MLMAILFLRNRSEYILQNSKNLNTFALLSSHVQKLTLAQRSNWRTEMYQSFAWKESTRCLAAFTEEHTSA